MPGRIERTITEPSMATIPERADAIAFGRRTGIDRRGFLGGSGLAAQKSPTIDAGPATERDGIRPLGIVAIKLGDGTSDPAGHAPALLS